MVKMSRSVCQRIRRIKNSLENAEQSFLDNKDMRGELDLMLAEAELSNLRRKKDVPWSWNRQLLAICAALAVIVSCFGGWCYARHNIPSAASVPVHNVNAGSPPAVIVVQQAKEQRAAVPAEPVVQADKISDTPVEPEQGRQLKISDTDMRRLVKSARVELTSSK